MSESLSGTIEHVTFHNPENGFVVLRVKMDGRRGLVTVIGQTASAQPGEYLEADGVWQMDSEHGEQFKAVSMRTAPPSTVEGIERYLGSGLIKGIGKQYAKRIVEVFGAKTLQVIDESPTFLREVKGIGAKRISEIRESWRQQKVIRDIIVFLNSHGIGNARAARIYKTYGDKSIETVRANPYRLAADIWGIGFATADQLAHSLNIPEHSPLRAGAALRHALKECCDDGHCGVPETDAIDKAQALTGIPTGILQDAVAAQIECKELIRETNVTPEPWLYLKRLFFAEINVAKKLIDLQVGQHPLPTFDVETALGWVEKKIGIGLAKQQQEAVRQAMTRKVLIITGGPGVGKTTLVRSIVEIFQAKNARVSLAAPTGRAARRLSESAGLPASTLHRLLECSVSGAQRTAEKPLEHDLLVVDEMSMVDLPLMDQLVRALPPKGCLVLVGDADQLPSVGPGAVLGDLIASKRIPVVHLTEIFRQAQESRIVQAAYRVHQGQLPESASPEKLGDFYFLEVDEPAKIQERIVTMVRDRIPARFGLDPFRDIQILTPMNRGDLGVRSLNVLLQQVLNPPQEEPEISRFGVVFRLGDKVLQTVNNYTKEVFNGDIGRIRKIDLDEQTVAVEFDAQPITYEFDELDELSHAFALTIHKSQGSEYPAVILPLHTQHYMLLQRNLLYTAITRGKKLVVIVGSRKALEMAVSRRDTSRRCTALAARLGR